MTLVEPLSRPARTRRVGTLTGYAVFHLNLMFSSIEEEQRLEVISRCYDPLLSLAEAGFPVGIEATGVTLEIIEQLRPDWIERLRAVLRAGRSELIGSGYSQSIGPLMPWQVVARNLALGRDVYRQMLGAEPSIALINEQAFSGGLVELYRDAGYDAIMMDWDDPAAHHPEWNRHWRYHPQVAVGADGSKIGLLWSNTIAFQKLQRLAHGDISQDDYVDYVLGHRSVVDRIIPLYTNDAECFDFRPGRFVTEERIEGSEWTAIAEAFERLQAAGVAMLLPSAARLTCQNGNAGHELRLEAASNPVPVKKQPKYNLTRWASSGRDDLAVNTQCYRAFEMLRCRVEVSDKDWKQLCYFWSSDFRTHITASRWSRFREGLDQFVKRLELSALASTPSPGSDGPKTIPSVEWGDRLIMVETAAIRVAFDTRRGLSVAAMGRPNERSLVGGLAHGTIDDISLSADWYTGNAVFEGPGEPKVTDLERCACTVQIEPATGSVILTTDVPTRLGLIQKIIKVSPDEARIEFDVTFHWPDWGKGSLRLGHVTLIPDAFDTASLRYRTHNGGRTPEVFDLDGRTVDLGAPVSFLISCRAGVGMTEGWLEVEDNTNAVRLEADMSTAAVIGLVEHKTIHGQTFCRAMLSALEMDETRKPHADQPLQRRFRYAISLRRINRC
jgi:hypothetical protein